MPARHHPLNSSDNCAEPRTPSLSARTKDEIDRNEARPHALPINPVDIPQALKECRQWVAWKYERRQDSTGHGKWTKVPVDPRTGKNASTNRPPTWATFEDALSALQSRVTIYAGIGFVFSPQDPFCGVDIDDCSNRETGAMREEAVQLVARLSSYTEVSPSRTGVKIFLRATLPRGSNRRGPIEIYDRGRYFAMTGHRLSESPATVENRQAELERLQQSLSRGSVTSIAKLPAAENQSPQCPRGLTLIEAAKRAHDGEKFIRLWSGDITGYQSNSEADLALCGLLAFWTGPDPVRIDLLFRQSGLFRDKWDAKRGTHTYGALTIQRALSGRTEFYSGNGHISCRAAPNPEDEFHRTDTGNAKRLVSRHGVDLRYCHPWQKWLVWDGIRWREDATAEVTYRAKETIMTSFSTAHRMIPEIHKHLEELAHDED